MILQVIVLRLINLVIQVHAQDRNPDLGLNHDRDQFLGLDQEAGHTLQSQGHHHSRQDQGKTLVNYINSFSNLRIQNYTY